MAGYTYLMPTASFRIDHHNVPNGISGWLATHLMPTASFLLCHFNTKVSIDRCL
ncbi:MAG: hypothetical protein IJK87_14330 [Prevotella sp.]|nr:hypothetical protein [Prevotella sp.]